MGEEGLVLNPWLLASLVLFLPLGGPAPRTSHRMVGPDALGRLRDGLMVVFLLTQTRPPRGPNTSVAHVHRVVIPFLIRNPKTTVPGNDLYPSHIVPLLSPDSLFFLKVYVSTT